MTVVPEVCAEEAEFSCQYISGPVDPNDPEIDMCASGDDIKFDPETGEFTFDGRDHDKYPPGEYDYMM